MTTKPAASNADAARKITQRIKELGDWRGEMLARVRQLIHDADPEIQEEWKWMGTPVWSHDGIVCTGESYKQVVKLTFARGASLADPQKLFNSSLEGNTRRAIDIREGEKLKEAALKKLFRAAIAANAAVLAERASRKKK
jgi:hypothetical protein